MKTLTGLRPHERYTIKAFAGMALGMIVVGVLAILIGTDWFGGIFATISGAVLGWIAWIYALKCIRDEVPG